MVLDEFGLPVRGDELGEVEDEGIHRQQREDQPDADQQAGGKR